jgi:hypothetical protein
MPAGAASLIVLLPGAEPSKADVERPTLTASSSGSMSCDDAPSSYFFFAADVR